MRAIASLAGCWVWWAFSLAAGCDVQPYHIDTSTDGGSGDSADAAPESDAPPRPDALAADAGPPDACLPHTEECNLVDDDCDGEIDEGFPPATDPANCGGCGNVCFRPNTAGTCAASMCEYACLAGFSDLNGAGTGTDADGCEYACLPTNGGFETCDFFDNDCDGLTDEDFNLTTDLLNCGGCGQVCIGFHATPICELGTCDYASCDTGFADLLLGVPGCEYQCPVFPTQPESCDGLDDDCDGLVDNGNPGGGAPCGNDTGECGFGTTTCSFGVLACVGGVGPAFEACDDLDNDCDGTADQTFNKLTDPLHCGGCTACNLPNAIEGCSAGVCTVLACLPGAVDLDGLAATGCEYACTPAGPEVCDGLDNDCDGLIDGADPGLAGVANFCTTAGACAGAAPVCGATPCDALIRWHCEYPAAETDACGRLALQETRCDGVDNDCDTAVDESFPLAGTACGDAGIGACRGTGSYGCNAMGDGLQCDITSPGALPAAEVCNGLDDDCNGALDEGAPNDMVHVVFGVLDFWIDRYEAARPDATAASQGLLEHRSCAKVGVQPWRNLTWDEANAACAASGRRLCTEAEWQAACAGPLAKTYPYGNGYAPDKCNGEDYDPDCASPDQDVCLPAGTPAGCPAPATSECVGDTGTVDMSGNLKEWTATQTSVSPPAYRLRGGAFDNIAPGLTCDYAFISAAPSYAFTNLGFRCCGDAGP